MRGLFTTAIAGAILLASASSATACEPAIPLFIALSGPTAGPAIILRSLPVLGAAIALKCIAFTFFEKSLPRPRAALLMFAGNLVTTSFGFLVGIAMQVHPILALVPITIVARAAMTPARRLSERAPISLLRERSPQAIGRVTFIALLASAVLFRGSIGYLVHEEYESYWVTKLAYIVHRARDQHRPHDDLGGVRYRPPRTGDEPAAGVLRPRPARESRDDGAPHGVRGGEGAAWADRDGGVSRDDPQWPPGAGVVPAGIASPPDV